MDNVLSKILEIGCSGLIGVILTLAVQHWFPAPQEIVVIINGEKVKITESDYSLLLAEKENIEDELSKVKEELSSTKEKLSSTSNELSSKEKELNNISNEAPKVEYSDFEIKIDGETTSKFVKGFLDIDGRQFILFDALNNITSEDINYSNNVLNIGHSTAKKVKLMDVCPPYDVSRESYYSTDSFEMTGKTYEGFSFGLAYRIEYVLINLEGKYSNLEFDFGHIDGSNQNDCTLNIYLDDDLKKTIEQRADSNVSHVSIPLNYAKHLKIEFDCYDATYGLGNIKLKY